MDPTPENSTNAKLKDVLEMRPAEMSVFIHSLSDYQAEALYSDLMNVTFAMERSENKEQTAKELGYDDHVGLFPKVAILAKFFGEKIQKERRNELYKIQKK